MEDESELLALRRARLDTWRELGIDPFGEAFPGAESCRQAIENYADDRPVRIAGRLISKREMGKNVFAHIQDESGKLQVYAQLQGLGEEKFKFWKLLDIGDFIGGEGTLFTTKTGEKTAKLSDLRILTKSLRPIPSQWYGLSDVEQRYRQRYVDLIVSEDARKVLLLRSQIVSEVRRFFEERAFIEVETPMMQTIAGGAAARPFVTKHNALGLDLYLRIAPELYLKRLLVGGFTKVFEINRNFRNEGISRRHNPEFTMLEAYWAYADFESMAQLVEDLIITVWDKVRKDVWRAVPKEMLQKFLIDERHLVLEKELEDAMLNSTSLDQKFQSRLNHAVENALEVFLEDEKQRYRVPFFGVSDTDGTRCIIKCLDFKRPWKRGRYEELIREKGGSDWFTLSNADKALKAVQLGCLGNLIGLEDFEITNKVFEHMVEGRADDPLFVTHLPTQLVPLAKQNAIDDNVVDVFELIIGRREVSPGYSELNNPVVQRQRLEKQAGEEQQKLDEDFLTALEYGMPPAGGIGIGIDRLVMTLTGAESIRDVILFPLLKPKT